MSCEDFEVLLSDYLDGTLGPAARRDFESHRQECAACATLAADAKAALSFTRTTTPVEPPPALITRILFHTPPMDRMPGRRRGWRLALTGWLGPVLQPRLAMGMAMTILSFSMVGRLAGLPERQLTAADLDPVRVWSTLDLKARRVWDRAVKYYEELRVVYEIQSRLREWSAQEEENRRHQSQAATVDLTSSEPDPASSDDRGNRPWQ